MKRLLIFSIFSFCLITVPISASAQFQIRKSKSQNQKNAELQYKLDSLQQAFDLLFNEYLSVIEPVSSNEDIIVDDSSSKIEYTPECIDSLLNVYYVQKNSDNAIDFSIIEDENLTSNIPDSVYIERLKRMNSFIPVQFNQIVKNSILTYTDKRPQLSSRIVGLSSYYLPKINEILDEYDLPMELGAMAVIESAFNPTAVSRAKAKGMWQFMYTTAKKYNLEMTSYVDERLDPLVSCRAAAQYLKDAYTIFGDWQLAIASYNCGSGNVNKAIRRSGGKTDFWDIYYYLPRETRGYIPAFIAALYLLRYYPEHGIVPEPIALPAHTDTIHVSRMLHFQQISDNIGISMEELRNMNTQYLHDIIPGSSDKTYLLQLPSTYTMAFVDKENEIYAYKDSIFFSEANVKKIKEGGSSDRIVHKVRSGETLGGIARRYGTTVSNIKSWNGLRSNTIRIGQNLYIYGNAASVNVSSSSSSSGSSAVATTKSSDGYVVYTVKKGDTLGRIAQANGVSLSTIYNLNGLNSRTTIYPGMKIRIRKAQ